MAKKVLLKTSSEPVFYTIVGISCHLMDYRIIHLMNRELGFSFVREEDLEINFPGSDQSAAFSFYSYHDEDQRSSYYLVSNFSNDVVLLSEFRHIDFILFMDGDFERKKKDALLNTIRSISKVQTAFEIRSEAIRNAESFLTDIEMHISDIRQEASASNQNIHLNLKGGTSHV